MYKTDEYMGCGTCHYFGNRPLMPTRYSAKESKKKYGNNDTINWEGWIMENTKILISNTQTKEIVTQFYLSSLTDGVGALFYT